MLALRSTHIYFEDGVRDGYLMLDGSRICGFMTPDASLDGICEVEDWGEARVIPGIVDTHVHGLYGYAANQAFDDPEVTRENIRCYLRSLAYVGVTSCFPTCTSTIREAAQVARSGGAENGAAILGIHSEGPYLNRVGEKGRPEPHPDVDMGFVRKMWEDSDGLLRLVAMSPEIPGTDEARDYLLSKGVTVAFAHSDCKSAEARAAIDAGYRVSTHTSNVMVGIHHRDIGGLGVMLDDPRVQCEIICDGLHVSLEWIAMMLKVKDPSQFMMVSDNCSPAGMGEGRYDVGFFTPVTITPEGFLVDDDGRLEGSSKPILYGIGNLVERVGLPLEDVIRLSSLNACRYYGFGDRKGSIALGKDADIAVISDDYEALATYVEGRKVFDRRRDPILMNPSKRLCM